MTNPPTERPDRNTDRDTNAHCEQCRDRVLRALYQLNIAAKEYKQRASDAYNNDYKHLARKYSQRKKALYRLKDEAIHSFVANGCVNEVTLHEIDERQYYCFRVGESDFSFHSPVSHWDKPPADAPDESRVINSFSADPEDRVDEMSEQAALQIFTDAFQSPNNYIEDPFVATNIDYSFVGWSDLPDAVELNSRVPERYVTEQEQSQAEWLFNSGDCFTTSQGEKCEIVDRCLIYATGDAGYNTLSRKPGYDVVRDGTKQTSVRQWTITHQWELSAESIRDPLPKVSGDFGNHPYTTEMGDPMADASVEFEFGDILELRSEPNADSTYCRLTGGAVNGEFILGKYEPIPPTETAPVGIPIDEIADNVVAVHESPPTTNPER